jgi:hypothetical protein
MDEDKTSFAWRAKTALIGMGAVASFYFAQYFADKGNENEVEAIYQGSSGWDSASSLFNSAESVQNLESNVEGGFLGIPGIEGIFDFGGGLSALSLGALGRNAGNSVVGSYVLAQMPEFVNFLCGNLSKGQMFGEAVKDGLMVGGCYVLGRIISGGRRGVKNTCSKYFSNVSFKKEQRTWWNGN